MSPGYLSVTPICFQDFGSFSLSLFGILYQVDSLSLPLLFGLVGIYPVPYMLGISLPFHLVYIVYISVIQQLVVPLYCGGSSLWVGLDGWLVEVSWLRKIVLVFWWVELDFFSLECNDVSSYEF